MSMKVPQFDLTRQFDGLRSEIMLAVEEVIARGHYILGPHVAAFEEEVAQYLGVKHAIGVANGTDALLLALKVLGVGAGDEVITTPFTFFATAEVVSQLGATPVFVDIEPESLNLDVAKVRPAITERTKAIIPVHIFGQSVDMQELLALSDEFGIPILEDACQAIGAEYAGRMVGAWGKLACFSFFPTKNLGCVGDGGLITTNDDALAQKVRVLRAHGSTIKYFHSHVGWNSRLDELQAAILRIKLSRLAEWTVHRQQAANRYAALLDGVQEVACQQTKGARTHVYHQYVVRVKERDKLQSHLSKAGVGTSIYYPCPLHLQEVYRDLGYGKGSFPHAEAATAEVLALPMFPEITEEEQRYVVECIKSYYKGW